MPHETSLITTVVAGVVLAFVLGAIAHRFRAPPLVGYLLAGVLVGPFTPGYVADQTLAPQLAELGVILLMFGVGLHFSLGDLLAVRRIAVPGALGQMAAATALGAALGLALGWSLAGALIFGLALSVASTVVLLKALEERGLVESGSGRIAVGWLIVEDLAMVLALVLIPALAGSSGGGGGALGAVVLTVVKVAAFAAVMLVAGNRFAPWLLSTIAQGGSSELFRVAVLALALGTALGAAEIFGVSLALGAFFAGMVLSETEFRHRAEADSLPLRDLFSLLFFVSVGMLFDPSTLVERPLTVAATVAIVVLGKSVAAYAIVRRLGGSARAGLLIAAALAQIGEFSFILAELGVYAGLLQPEGRDLILAAALISILLHPLTMRVAERLRDRVEHGASAPAPATPSLPPTQAAHVVVIGLGRVGRAAGAALDAANMPWVGVDASEDAVERLCAGGGAGVAGDPARLETLTAAGVPQARAVLVTAADGADAALLAARALAAGATVVMVADAADDETANRLAADGITTVPDARELAEVLVRRITSAGGVEGRSTPPT